MNLKDGMLSPTAVLGEGHTLFQLGGPQVGTVEAQSKRVFSLTKDGF